MSMATMMMMQSAQARRRRDDRGRYMDGDQDGPQMMGQYSAYDNIPRSDDQGTRRQSQDRRGAMDDGREMRRIRDDRRAGGYDQPENRDRPDMKGEGYFVWDGMDSHMPPPYSYPPERYGQPEGRVPDWETRKSNVTDMMAYTRRDYPRSHMGQKEDETPKSKIGFAQADHHKGLDMHTAEKWVKSMHNADGSTGGRWRMEELQQVARNFGIAGEEKLIEFFAVINAMYSDFGAVAKQFGVDKMDFYAAMAKAWINDKDAVKDKAGIYYRYVVKKDEEEEDDD